MRSCDYFIEITCFVISQSCHASTLSPCHLYGYISSLKSAKHRLSNLALEEIFGRENIDEIFGDADSDKSGNEVSFLSGTKDIHPNSSLIYSIHIKM